MPYKEIQIEKIYFTISEVASQFNIAPSVLRYWESEFIIIQPKKSKKGDRLYTKQDIENIKLIYHLLRTKGFTIEGAKKYLKENKNAHQQFELIESLQKLKSFLIDLKENLG
jgi:DNA-binding transcriptional MerR regulator